MRAGYVQLKPEFCNVEYNINRINELIKDSSFDLLVVPELSNSGYLFTGKNELEKCAETVSEGKFCTALAKIANEKNAHVVAGLSEKAGDKFFNSAVLVNPAGEFVTYRKIHLFNEEKLWFSPGESPFNVYCINVNGEKVIIGIMICYDWLYPESARSLALQGAQIICHPSNLVMPYCQDAMYARAVENRVFTITANRIGKDVNNGRELNFTGQSVIIDPKGNYLRRASENSEECYVVEINPADALNKRMNDHNSIFDDMRRDMYYSP